LESKKIIWRAHQIFTVSCLSNTLRSAVAGAGAAQRYPILSRQLYTLEQRLVPPILTHLAANSITYSEPQQHGIRMSDDIEELHALAVQKGSISYTDPTTGFTVFTELAHLRRGTCCGNQCRHCPYGWENTANGTKRNGKCKSGDFDAAKRLVESMTLSKEEKSIISTGVLNSEQESCLPNDTSLTSLREGKGGRKGGKYTSKNVPYTRKGDKGTSQLLTGERRSKADDAFEAMGTVDELCTVVGVVHAELMSAENANELFGDLPEWLLDVMSRLFDLGSHVAKPKKDPNGDFDADGVGGGFDSTHSDQLEDWIDLMTEDLPELVSFILPTGSKGAAQLQVARTVCRRAERRVVDLVDKGVSDPNGLRYLNRLSDFFFTAARWVNFKEGREEIQYRREYRGAKQRSRKAVSLAGAKSEK
jgi:cob(I)alamin adenosyltransferase